MAETTKLGVLFVLIVFVLVVYVIARRGESRRPKRFVKDWHEAFPGKCLICACDRYGRREGHIKPGEPGPVEHWCEEGMPAGHIPIWELERL